MKEQQWLGSTNPYPMLHFLAERGSDRCFRLFACGCSRRAWHLLVEEDSRNALDVFEQFAQGGADHRTLRRALAAARRAGLRVRASLEHAEEARNALEMTRHQRGDWWEAKAATAINEDREGLAWLVWRLLHDTVNPDAEPGPFFQVPAIAEAARTPAQLAELAAEAVAEVLERDGDKAREYHRQAELVRCLWGNPFRPVNLNHRWLTPTVTNLAETVYQERAFDRMPVLGDALEDAGCGDQDLLNHCRQPGKHGRGCWVVGLLLRKS